MQDYRATYLRKPIIIYVVNSVRIFHVYHYHKTRLPTSEKKIVDCFLVCLGDKKNFFSPPPQKMMCIYKNSETVYNAGCYPE